jgi:pimeloyl-ACP methyl ester carboxylesterase
MDTSKNPDEHLPNRRRFLSTTGTAAVAAGALQLGLAGRAGAQVTRGGPGKAGPAAAAAGTTPPFGPVQQVDAGVLNVGYVDIGPASGQPVVLMHGFPYDIHSYEKVAPLLAAQGYRAIVPYFRGYGTTTFRSAKTPRNVDQVAFALDILALMDALHIKSAILAGYDWGSRTGDIIAALWPDRCKALISVTGYLITNLAANRLPIPPKNENDWWYQYYFCTPRGVLGLEEYRYEMGQFIWTFNSPTFKYSQETYDRTAAAFNNPDYVPIVIGNYRWRLSLAPAEPEYLEIENKLQKVPTVGVPTITIDGRYDPFTPPGNGSAYRDHFTGKYAHKTFPVGHNVPQEAPEAFAKAVIEADHLAWPPGPVQAG